MQPHHRRESLLDNPREARVRAMPPRLGDRQPDQFDQLRLLYERYCTHTNFPMPSAVTAFFPTMEKRSAGYTRCLGVRFADGSSTTFSLDKALSAVASVRV